MKVRNLFLTAFAASMALVACNSDDELQGVVEQQDTQAKSVNIKLANVQNAVKRSVEEAAKAGEAIQLNKFTIFFVDAAGSMAYEGYAADVTDKATATPLPREFTIGSSGIVMGTDGVEGIPTYHFIDANVTKVIVVGNYPDNWTEPTTETDLKNTSVLIEDQQEIDKLLLIGEDGLVQKATEANPVVPAHTNVYEANVELKPLVARVEVAAFRYNQVDETTPREYTSIVLNHLAINNYAPSCTYGKVLGTPNTSTSISATTVWPFFERLAAVTETVWHNDKGMNINLVDTTDPEYTNDVDVDVDDVYAYNVFAGAVPQLVLSLTGKKADGTTAALYLATKSLGVTTFEAGKIYRFDIVEASEGVAEQDSPFEFDDEDLQNPDKCVDVTVSVMNWDIDYLTPEF